MQIINTLTDGTKDYLATVTLDGVPFTLEIYWNDREGQWYFSIYDLNQTPLITGRKIALYIPLLSRFKNASLPNGDFICYDTSGSGIDPSLNDLGIRCPLVYIEAAELPALANGTFVAS